MKNSDQLTPAEQPQETEAEKQAHLHALLSKMRDVMLVTYEATGSAPVTQARPMHVTKLEEDHSIWFMASHDSRKGEQLKQYSGAMVTGQADSRWVSMTGKVDIVRDRATIESMWSKGHEVWFPDGPSDPSVALFHFVPDEAEYWDASGRLGVKYLYEAARALVTGTAARDVKGQHGEVTAK